MSKLRVAVIGVGPSGICALRHMSMKPNLFDPVGFEINREVGGLWNYSDNTDVDEYGLPCLSSMYKQLRINLATDAMAFQDRKFRAGLPSFADYKEVKLYLDDYCKTYDLNKYCKFQTIVQNVKPQQTEDGLKWFLTSRDLTNDEISTDIFDNVIVCNGKEGDPFIPDYPGLDKFKGIAIHTKNLRDLELYKGKKVLLVGSSYSAQDIIFELAPIIPKMYASHRSKGPLPFDIPENVEDVPIVTKVLPNGVILENGECREVDVIIFATGYKYYFPFLSEECGIKVKDERIQPIYNQMFHIEFPTLIFIGLLKGVLEFQAAYVQAHYVCGVMAGDIKLPPKAEMYRQEEEDYQKRVVATGLPPKYAHDLFGVALEPYIDKLEKESGKRLIQKGTFKFWDVYCDVIDYEFGTLKQRTFHLIGDDDFEMIM